MPSASEYFRDRVRILDLQFELESGVPEIAIVKEPATAVPSTYDRDQEKAEHGLDHEAGNMGFPKSEFSFPKIQIRWCAQIADPTLWE